MVRGVLIALGWLLFAGVAAAQPPDSPPAEAPAAKTPPADNPPLETPPAEAPAAEAAPPEPVLEPPPPPPPPVLPAFAPIQSVRPQVMAPRAPVTEADDPARFIVGQVWALKSPAAESLRVRIGRVDDLNGRLIIHVTILGAPCPPALGCETRDIAHAPFEQPTLTTAVDHVVARDQPSDDAFARGYRYWRESARGAAWTIGPAEAADIALQEAVRHLPPPPLPVPPESPPTELTPTTPAAETPTP